MTIGRRAGVGLALGVAPTLHAGAAPNGIMLVEATSVRDFWIERDTVTDGFADRVVRGAGHGDPADSLRVTFRRPYGYRGLARRHHFIGFRWATSEDLGGR